MSNDFSRSVTAVLFGCSGLLLVGCSSGGGNGPSTGSGGSTATGSGGSTGSGGAAPTGSGGVTGSGGTVEGTGGSVGSGGGAMDAPVDTATTQDAPTETAAEVPSGPFALTSSAFTMGMEVPLMYKCDQVTPRGMNISPPLSWTPGPAGTKSYAMTLIHNAPDMSKHWVMWDIPASVTSLAMNVEHVAMPATPAGAKQVHVNLDGFNGFGYLGPCPQAMNSRQNYLYAVYALKVETLPNITPNSTSEAAYSAIQANMVTGGRATLQGTQIQQ
ncbi:MAG TPA: YbhB/YbcL family Raf kinase inhibitor-like protein [Polyangia bacterium]|nr:YbhB/YbcL family Raf kinase inhibitor-like protein [Polyangia bacterium]